MEKIRLWIVKFKKNLQDKPFLQMHQMGIGTIEINYYRIFFAYAIMGPKVKGVPKEVATI